MCVCVHVFVCVCVCACVRACVRVWYGYQYQCVYGMGSAVTSSVYMRPVCEQSEPSCGFRGTCCLSV